MTAEQCQARIYKPETYRRSGRAKDGFAMHYVRAQCIRMTKQGDYCWQHRVSPASPAPQVVGAGSD